jgi:acetyltransferase-like isoleucine patch superfamily enzyme
MMPIIKDVYLDSKRNKYSLRRILLITLRAAFFAMTRKSRYWESTRDSLISVEGRDGQILRRCFYGRYFKSFGNNVVVGPNSFLEGVDKIEIGEGSQINRNTYINGAFGVVIGDKVLIGPGTVIHSANHKIPSKKTTIKSAGFEGAQTIIGDDVWVAANSNVLAGVKIGKGAVVGAGSVVTKSVDEYKIVAGIPAGVISERSEK